MSPRQMTGMTAPVLIPSAVSAIDPATDADVVTEAATAAATEMPTATMT